MKLCVLIPVFNHFEKIDQIIEQIIALGLPCIILDDGSHDDCKVVLEKLGAAEHVRLVRYSVNRGKGAVVCDGMQLAYDSGYSHVLQVDADGQHNLNDIPAFISLAKLYPGDIVSGERRYSQLPASRRYGRMLTDFWVWVNTLSLQIRDSMCGFRLYPLAPTIALLSRKKIGSRMDFDTDILVRLYWEGVDVRHVTTRIIYGDETISHFRLFQDNVRITRMHTRLFFGMLIRVPQLLFRQKKL